MGFKPKLFSHLYLRQHRYNTNINNQQAERNLASRTFSKPFPSGTTISNALCITSFSGGSSSTSDSIYIPSGARAILAIFDSSNIRQGLFLVTAYSNGTNVTPTEIYKGSGLTLSTDTNTLTITKASSTLRYLWISPYNSEAYLITD